ncbi:MAG: tRNA uridine-5-carboxymethylaminomethyl(34) synthesis GTPase MnmE [Leptospirales bacterium]|nr:tRNA uridine-5-carboxymethylaminomethyl(34) synthesis GTPase MnmE [Leptospirales bacterium]
MHEDTICAPATPPVNAPIAIIRVSGPESLAAAERIFSKVSDIKPREAVYGFITDGEEKIDNVILIYYKSPASYTGEDMLEIFSHGNPIIVRRIIQLLIALNIRMAEPGEFSKRAFFNNKMDLTEAEAVNQIILGKTQWEVSAAIEQMHGSLRTVIGNVREKIVLLKADIEALIDFSDQDIDFAEQSELAGRAISIKADISDILRRCRAGDKISSGFNLSIAGKPNVGKSSIFNLILNKERAIVSAIAGTTRDLIRESVIIEGIPFNIHDTAGIRESEDEIERAGINLSKNSIDSASIVLVVIDALSGIDKHDTEILDAVKDKNYIVLINKTDAANEENIHIIENEIKSALRFSAKTGDGLQELEKRITSVLKNEFVPLKNSFIADIRIINLLEESLAGMETVIETTAEHGDITAFELQLVMDKLGEITGEISPDEVLDSIFGRFCIGK